jgi:hypothetical protein
VVTSANDGMGLSEENVVSRRQTSAASLPPANVHGAVKSRVTTG